jgi:hypothetical protein
MVLCEPWQYEFGSEQPSTIAFNRMVEILPDACVNTLDKAGRTVLHWAVAHYIFWAVEILLKSRKARPDVTFQTVYIKNITAFHLILLYENYSLWLLYRGSLEDDLKRDFCYFLGGLVASRGIEKLIAKAPLLWAILMGRNEFVKDIMATEVVCPHLSTSLTLTLRCSIA